MRVQNSFNFRRVDILTKAHDQFLGSANDKEVSVLQTGKVPGVEPSLGIDRCSRLLWRVIVTFHDVRTAHPQLADLSVGNHLLIGSDQFDLDSRQNTAHRSVSSMFSDDSLSNVRRAFRDSISVVEHHAEKALYLRFHGGLKRRARRGNDPKSGKFQ